MRLRSTPEACQAQAVMPSRGLVIRWTRPLSFSRPRPLAEHRIRRGRPRTPLERRDVQLGHLEHGVEGTLRCFTIDCAQILGEHLWHDLPGDAEPVFQPAAD